MTDQPARTRPHDWAAAAMLFALVLATTAIAYGNFAWGVAGLACTGVLGVATRRFSQSAPGPMPHALRWVLFLPRGTHSVAHLRRILAPLAGERILEIGPGIGVHSLPIAEMLAPDGALEALDAQAEMLADLERRATRAGIDNVIATHGDAQNLPYDDGSFDAAYLIGVLGEIPDVGRALAELRRVLKPDGRLVVGEMVFDPDYVSPAALERAADSAGFVFETRQGPWLAYFTRFTPARVVETPSG